MQGAPPMSIFSNIFAFGLISQLVAPILSFLNVLLSTIIRQCIIFSESKVSKLNRLFTKRGWRQTHYLTPGKNPGEGWCILFIHWGFVIGHKSCIRREQKGDNDQYHLYIFGAGAYEFISTKMEGNKSLITVVFISNPTIWRCEFTTTHLCITNEPSKWQAHILEQIMQGYGTKKRFSVLVHGEPGVGKSELAYFLNKAFRNDSKYVPQTIVCDPTKKGLSMGNVIQGNCKECPVIVLFNEYDTIVRHAESQKEGKSDGTSPADTRTSFLNVLDQLEKTLYVILIATMNGEPERDVPFVYRRPGRMDLVYGVPKSAKPFE